MYGVTCVGRNPSFFRSANTAIPPVHPSRFALSPLVLLVVAAGIAVPVAAVPSAARCPPPATGCQPFASRRTGDSGSAQLMKVTKVEMVPSFKVAISDSRESRARSLHTLTRGTFRI